MRADAKTKWLSALGVAAVIALNAFALDEPLPRRGLLGVQFKQVEANLRQQLGLDRGTGVQVLEVMPDSAARAAGLEKDDVVLSVDEYAVGGADVLAAVVNEIGSHRGGDEIVLRVLRDGKERIIAATLTPMPKESYAEFDTAYGSVDVDGALHRTIVTKPKGEGPFPAVLFLQGLGCGSIDAWYNEDDHVRQLLAGFTNAGFVTVRAEKRGVGDSEGAPCNEMDFQTELRGHQAALAYAQSLEYTGPVFLFGHSMGGVFAPLVAADHVVAGVVVFGTIGKPLPTYYAETVERQLILNGASNAVIAQRMQICNEFISFFFGDRLTPGEIDAKNPKFESFFNVRDADAIHFHGVHYTFWHQLDDIDKAEAWTKVSAPVLILYGEADYAASRDDHSYIRDAVNAAHPRNATYLELENIGHAFETADTQQVTMQNRFAGEFNPVVVDTTVQWMRENS